MQGGNVHFDRTTHCKIILGSEKIYNTAALGAVQITQSGTTWIDAKLESTEIHSVKAFTMHYKNMVWSVCKTTVSCDHS